MNRIKLGGHSAARADRLAPALARALGAAAKRAADALHGKLEWPAEQLVAELERLAAVVAAQAAAGACSAPDNAPGFAAELVTALRAALLAELSAAPPRRLSGTELVAVLQAFDHVSGPATTPSTESYADMLARSDALNGMLEIAHDMRSPLAAILLLVEPMRRGQKGPVTPVQERQLGLVYGAALSLSALANDVMEAARGRTRASLAMRPFSIGTTMQDVCDIVRPIAEEKRLELLLSFPQVDGRIGDAAAIHRVLLNLATNALKYTERGSVSVGCTELDETRVEFWVRDTGTGIPADALAVLAEGLAPAMHGTHQFSSAGLGLAICRTLLEAMESALAVETAPESGTRFSFVLALPRAPHE